MQVARDDRLQRVDQVCGKKHRVLGEIRQRRVRTLAGRDDLEDVVSAHQRADARRERAERAQRPVVQAVDRLHRKAVEQALLDHDAPAALVLLRRLEDEVERAVESAALRHRLRGAEQHRRVAVVAARVHASRVARRVRGAGRFLDVQRVEIGAQADRAIAATARSTPTTPVFASPVWTSSPKLLQLARRRRRRRRLLERGLRMRVQMVPPLAHLALERGDFGNDVHRSSSCLRIGRRDATSSAGNIRCATGRIAARWSRDADATIFDLLSSEAASTASASRGTRRDAGCRRCSSSATTSPARRRSGAPSSSTADCATSSTTSSGSSPSRSPSARCCSRRRRT